MYNGIGLQTPRGSGTNGYVQRNAAFIRPQNKVDYREEMHKLDSVKPVHRKPNQEILEHERKRQVELKLLEFQDAMEERGFTEEEIEKKISETRRKLMDKALRERADDKSNKGMTDTHALALAKERENTRVAAAFGIRRDHVEGEAFDRDLQERKKIEKHEQWMMKQEEFKSRNLDSRGKRGAARLPGGAPHHHDASLLVEGPQSGAHLPADAAAQDPHGVPAPGLRAGVALVEGVRPGTGVGRHRGDEDGAAAAAAAAAPPGVAVAAVTPAAVDRVDGGAR